MRVFIADDSAIVRGRLSTLLQDLPGVEVAGEAGDTGQAYESVRTLKPEAIIVDLRMPGNAWKLIHDLKAWQSRLKVIVLTNYASTAYRRRSMEAGADHFLDKSADIPELRRVLRELTRYSIPANGGHEC